jgi:putative flippase GtrA
MRSRGAGIILGSAVGAISCPFRVFYSAIRTRCPVAARHESVFDQCVNGRCCQPDANMLSGSAMPLPSSDDSARSASRAATIRTRLASLWQGRAISLKAASFALVGVVNTAVDYGVFLLARSAYQHMPAALWLFDAVATDCRCSAPRTVHLIAANITSWTVAVSGSYVMNASITFAAESGRQLRLRRYLTFILAGVIGLVANTAVLVFAVQILLLPAYIAKAVAILASFVVNFSLSHFIVFRVRHDR